MINKIRRAIKIRKLAAQKNEYSSAVQEYLRINRDTFVPKWAALCEATSGRISYTDMSEVLGNNYPKAPWIDILDVKGQIVTFFKEINIPFKADETHLYFP